VARPWCDKLGQIFGQQFVVENRGGASGLIGTEAAVKSAPDGYTLLMSSNTTPINLPLLRKVPYDPKSLTPVARLGDVVTGFVIHSAVGVKTFKEMLDYAKANPGKLAFGSSGSGTGPHMRYEMLRYKTGVDILHVPYRGGADSLVDLLANHIQMMNERVTLPHVKAGKLHLLNINHSERSSDFPDIPTLTELGYANADAPIWFGLWAPTGTPVGILQRLNDETIKASKTPEMKEKLRLAGAAPVTQTLERSQPSAKLTPSRWRSSSSRRISRSSSRLRPHPLPPADTLAHVSRRPTVRLNTGRPGWDRASRQK
jgi:tripartite-type tricarboxylate transporter receptor subunit TctC